jgi:hypothetical protein
MPDREGTEATYLDPTAPRKCVADHLEDGFDNTSNVAVLGDVGAALPSFAPIPTLSRQSPV